METFGQRIKRLRDDVDITQAELARRAGTTGQAISNYERDGGGIPRVTVVASIARALGVSVADVLEDVELPREHVKRRPAKKAPRKRARGRA